MEADIKADEVGLAGEATCSLADGPSDVFRTLDNFLLNNTQWGKERGYKFVSPTLDPCHVYVKKYVDVDKRGKRTSLDTPAAAGVLRTHVGDILPSGTDNSLRLFRAAIDSRFNSVEFPEPPFTLRGGYTCGG